MMSVAKTKYTISEQEYLAGELESDVKHEYVYKEVYAMAGAKRAHVQISFNIGRNFGNHLQDSLCQTLSSDMKVKVEGNYYYPDVLVDCTGGSGEDIYTETPVIIVEVLSDSTRRLDKTFKKDQYTKIPTLKEYILVEQDFCKIEAFRRSNDWSPVVYFLGDDVYFESIELTLSVREIYDRVISPKIAD